jgi:hypothetical protein
MMREYEKQDIGVSHPLGSEANGSTLLYLDRMVLAVKPVSCLERSTVNRISQRQRVHVLNLLGSY